MGETKKELTVEEMNNVIQDYCHYQHSCPSCEIVDVCESCNGVFTTNPIQCKEAYDIIMKSPDPTALHLEADEFEPEDTPFDVIERPEHYNHSGMECIDEMILIFGKEAVMHFCVCNAWKYRKRAIYKNGEEDMKKSDWYMNKYKELSEMVIANGKA